MMLAIVTGAPERAALVTDALQRDGVRCIVADSPAALTRALPDEPADIYVQLPIVIEPRGDELVARIRNFLTDGLLARFDLASTALRVLAPGAQVVLVGGHPGITPTAPDDPAARLALINVLAHAIKAQQAPEPVHVHVLDHMETPGEVSDAALGRSRATPSAPGAGPDDSALSYEDWRVEVMGLVGAHF